MDYWNNRAISGGIRLAEAVVEDCLRFAIKNGWEVFAMGYGKECFTSGDAGDTYQQHGTSEKCQNGLGGWYAIDVYRIFCTGTVKCFS